jgi:hypothetical protein
MKRRTVLVGLGAAAAGWPRAVSAQQPAMPVIGLAAALYSNRSQSPLSVV